MEQVAKPPRAWEGGGSGLIAHIYQNIYSIMYFPVTDVSIL